MMSEKQLEGSRAHSDQVACMQAGALNIDWWGHDRECCPGDPGAANLCLDASMYIKSPCLLHTCTLQFMPTLFMPVAATQANGANTP